MIVTVHDGKGKKDRTVPLPEFLKVDLQAHLKRVYALHEQDVERRRNARVRRISEFLVSGCWNAISIEWKSE